MLGKIVVQGDKDIPFFDPNLANLVAEVSTQVCITFPQIKKIVRKVSSSFGKETVKEVFLFTSLKL